MNSDVNVVKLISRGGAVALGGAIVSGMPANPMSGTVSSGVLMGAGVGLMGIGAALYALE